MFVFQGCDVYGPEPLGRKDVLAAGGRFVAVAARIDATTLPGCEVIDAAGLKMVPGLIDGHVHIAGAGGEGGPSTRTPELRLSQLLDGGVTTVIGCLGTDGIARTVDGVLMKAKALKAEGVSCWIYTGAYQLPVPTITGDPGRDIALVEEVIGVGEVAVSDHRSSGPTVDELIHLAGRARVGGMLGGKAGIICFHMGDAKDPFRILYQIAERSELKLTQFIPTHVNRNDYIFEDAKTYGKTGYVDITASSYPYYPQYEVKPAKAVVQLVEAGVPLEHITLSSDAIGSLPDFDAQGNLIKLDVGEPKSIFTELVDLATTEGFPLEKALCVVTANVARILKLPRKGRIAPGFDADAVFLDADWRIRHLVARGELMVRDAVQLRKGTFER